MIISEKFSEIKKNGRIYYYVFRRCDECGKEEKARFDGIMSSRKKRKQDIDFCWLCGNKNRKFPNGNEHKSFKHGISQSGYKRVTRGKKRMYEHKFIIESSLGREVTKDEEIHHIDYNKINNELSNLYLCSKKFHKKMLKQITELGFVLLNKYIWFSEELKKYVLYKTNMVVKNKIDMNIYTSKNNREVKISKYICRRTEKGCTALHVCVMEKSIGRKMYYNEVVHHMDGNTHNNEIDNLFLLTRKEHRICHSSLSHCIAELYKQGIVIFKDGIYSIK